MVILAIETSCDETAVAIVESKNDRHQILANIVSSQAKIHAKYGGVVPNLASREHLKNIIPCLKQVLGDFNLVSRQFRDQKPLSKTSKSLTLNRRETLSRRTSLRDRRKTDAKSFASVSRSIDLIAVTIGPGLIPALLIGTNTAKALSFAWRKPVIGINHIEAHIYANFLEADRFTSRGYRRGMTQKLCVNSRLDPRISASIFPALCLVVSGGHTQLILMKDHGKYKLLGETRDDAAGEAFDKVAKLLGLGYPGGPAIAQQAEQWKSQILSTKSETNFPKISKSKIELPRPMINTKNYDFSFSGLKTAVLYLVKKGIANFSSRSDAENRDLKVATPDICASFQQAVIDVLIAKTIRAAGEHKVKTVMLAGGVAANLELRKQLSDKLSAISHGPKFLVPPKIFCTDNAVMVAVCAYYRALRGKTGSWRDIEADANLRIV